MDHSHLHARARTKGVNPIVYWLTRAILQPVAHLYWRLSRIGGEHIPQEGPVIFVANHRSFLDPFIVGLCTRRPVYYVAKQELFTNRILGGWISSLGAFPLETGATVVPVAVKGTEAIRNGWRVRPHKIRVRIGAPLNFPQVESATAQLAAAVTDRIWPNVMLQWEWLGGLPPLRRAAVIGARSWGTAIAVMLARAGIDVDLGTRTRAQAELMAATRSNDRYLPGVELSPRITPVRATELELCRGPGDEVGAALGQTAEAVAAVPLLAQRLQNAGVDAPVLRGLAGIIEGEVEPARWTAGLTASRPTRKAEKAKAA